MTDKYADIENIQWDNIPEPKTLPDGTYLLKGTNVLYVPKDEENDKSARVAFFYEAKEAMDDVDAEELAKLGDDYDLANSEIVKQFFLNKARDWAAVRKHIEAHGIDTAGKSLPETFDAFRGTEVLSVITTKEFVSKTSGELVVKNEPTLFEKA